MQRPSLLQQKSAAKIAYGYEANTRFNKLQPVALSDASEYRTLERCTKLPDIGASVRVKNLPTDTLTF